MRQSSKVGRMKRDGSSTGYGHRISARRGVLWLSSDHQEAGSLLSYGRGSCLASPSEVIGVFSHR